MKISRRLLSSLTFRPFTREDYYGFAGVQSPVPLIAENDKCVVIIDGDTAELYTFDVDGTFDCVDVCECIRDLPSETEVEKRIAELQKELADLSA